MKKTAIAVIAASSALLAACGGGTTTTTVTEQAPAPAPTSANQNSGQAPQGNQQPNNQTGISQQEAEDIALKDAGVTRDQVTDFSSANLDTENNTQVWEVGFEVGEKDYSYDIDANTGAIVHRNSDM